MHQLQRSWVRSQHPSAQWNLRGGRWSSAEYSTKQKEKIPPPPQKKIYIYILLMPIFCRREHFVDWIFCWCQYFVDANILSTWIFCRCQHFVDLNILSPPIFCGCQYFVCVKILRMIIYWTYCIINDCVLCISWLLLICVPQSGEEDQARLPDWQRLLSWPCVSDLLLLKRPELATRCNPRWLENPNSSLTQYKCGPCPCPCCVHVIMVRLYKRSKPWSFVHN